MDGITITPGLWRLLVMALLFLCFSSQISQCCCHQLQLFTLVDLFNVLQTSPNLCDALPGLGFVNDYSFTNAGFMIML